MIGKYAALLWCPGLRGSLQLQEWGSFQSEYLSPAKGASIGDGVTSRGGSCSPFHLGHNVRVPAALLCTAFHKWRIGAYCGVRSGTNCEGKNEVGYESMCEAKSWGESWA